MNRKIKIIKRAVRNLRQDELETKALESRAKANGDSPTKMARTIHDWVRERRQRANEELLAARLLKSVLYDMHVS